MDEREERYNQTQTGRKVLVNRVVQPDEQEMKELKMPKKTPCPFCKKEYEVASDALDCRDSHLDYDKSVVKPRGFKIPK